MTLDAYRDTFRFAARYWLLSPSLFGLMMVARIASNLVDIFVPLASGALVDTLASGGGDLTTALRALAHLIGLVVAFHALRTIVAWAIIYVSSRAMEALVRDAFARVQRFSSDWHANSFAGATVRKITRGMWSFDQLSDTLLFGIFPAAVVVIGVTTLLVSRWPLLGGVVAIGIAVYLSISVSLLIYWIAPAGQAQQRLDSALGARLADSLAGNQVVKDFAAETREDASLAGLTREWRQAARLNWNRDNTTGFFQSLTLIAMQAALLGTGLILWSRGSFSTGDVVSVIGFQGLLNAYLRDFGQHVRNVQKAVNEMEDVVGFDVRAPDIVEAPNARSLRVTAGEIVFEDVSFTYPNSQRPLYQKLKLTIGSGERVGLVGASGAGKTTLVKLLQRYYDIDGGRILVDGQDIALVTLASLRRAIGVVAQEPMLFHRPLGENIAFGRPEANPSEIKQAARRAHADVFIDRLSGATARWWASAASSSPAANVSGSPSPAPSSPIRRSSCWTKPRRRSIPCRNIISAPRSRNSRMDARPWSWRIAFPRCGGLIASSSSRTAASSRTGRTRNSCASRTASIGGYSRRKRAPPTSSTNGSTPSIEQARSSTKRNNADPAAARRPCSAKMRRRLRVVRGIGVVFRHFCDHAAADERQ